MRVRQVDPGRPSVFIDIAVFGEELAKESEELAEFQNRSERIDPDEEIARARTLVRGNRDPSSGDVSDG